MRRISILIVGFCAFYLIFSVTPKNAQTTGICGTERQAIKQAYTSTATPEPDSEQKLWDAYDKCLTQDTNTSVLPGMQTLRNLPYKSWQAAPTFKEDNSTVAKVQAAISNNNGNIALAVYKDEKWKFQVFGTTFDHPKPLFAFINGKQKVLYIAVYFQDSDSALNIYHLSPDGGAVLRDPVTLQFDNANEVIVDKDGCFSGTQQTTAISFCPEVKAADGSIYYPAVKQ